MRFDIITIFPTIFDSYCQESIIKRARQKKLLDLRIHDLRKFTKDKHRKTDDRPYGGGPGMVMNIQPIDRALRKIVGPKLPLKSKKKQVILLTPQGKFFTQKTAQSLSDIDQVILVCGRYEGFDERVRALVNQQISIGPYVLTGGELPAMMIMDSVIRLVSGVLGDKDSPKEETFTLGPDQVEYPQYTRPETFKGKSVPKALLSGDHQAIAAWRKKHTRRHPSVKI
ncbi:MAG: tRNA (guanosine(37)-N1)-methyltransferase TrmD [bacterium]